MTVKLFRLFQNYCKITITLKIILIFYTNLYALDTAFYINTYPDLKQYGITAGKPALDHYLKWGFYERRQAAAPIQNTNFDWKYYVISNALNHIKTKEAAIAHYTTIGHVKKLPYCKKFTICILLHLYNINLIDELIDNINYFISINNINNFYIKINIPIGANLTPPLKQLESYTFNQNKQAMLNTALQCTPYHKYLINNSNYSKIYSLCCYLQDRLAINKNRLQIIFSENRGLDIGGFFLLLDQVVKENLKIDYIIKLHSKSHHAWRSILSSFLNLRINKLLRKTEFVYACSLDFNWNAPDSPENFINLTYLLNYFKLPKANFSYSAGTMFIASNKLIDFFAQYNIFNLFNHLNIFTAQPRFETIEHAYERFFGYLITYLNLKQRIIGYIERTAEITPSLTYT